MDASPRGPVREDSRGRPVSRGPSGSRINASFVPGVALAGAAFLGAILLIVADLSTLYEVKAGAKDPAAVVKTTSGHAQHSFALVVLGIAALAMAYGATRRGSRPAMAALLTVGVVALVIALVGDLPDATSSGAYGKNFADARAVRGSGFYLETLGAFLLLIAGSAGLFLSSPNRRPARPRRERPPRRDTEPPQPDAEPPPA
jgi:hypothetical protein